MQHKPTSRITYIDQLRGLAAVAVVVFHLTRETSYNAFITNVLCMGVELFFIISGFVIFMTIEKVNRWQDFVWGRFWRLYPVYWACVILTFLLITGQWFLQKVTFQNYTQFAEVVRVFFANMTMVQYFLNEPHIDGSYLTLTLELQFYIVMLVLLLTGQLKNYLYYGLVLVALALLYLYQPFLYSGFGQKLLQWLPLLRYFPLFLTGMCMYRLKFKAGSKLLYLVIICCFIALLAIFDILHWHEPALLSFTEYSLTLAVIYLLALAYLFIDTQAVTTTIGVWLGKISYSLYAVHQHLGRYVLMPLLVPMLGQIPALLLSFGGVILVTYFIHNVIEQPSQAYYKNKKAR